MRGFLVDHRVAEVAQLPAHVGELSLQRLDGLLLLEHALRQVRVLPFQVGIANLQLGGAVVHGPEQSPAPTVAASYAGHRGWTLWGGRGCDHGSRLVGTRPRASSRARTFHPPPQ